MSEEQMLSSEVTRTSNGDIVGEDGLDYEIVAGPTHSIANELSGSGAGELVSGRLQQASPFDGGRRRATLVGVFLLCAMAAGAGAWLMAGSLAGNTVNANVYRIPGAGEGPTDGGFSTAPRVGALAPDFELIDIQTQKPVSLSSLRGRPVWINFWASWCPPCKAELPIMQEKYEKYKGKGLAIVGIDMREAPSDVRSFTNQNGYKWTFVVDTDGKVTDRYFTAGIPTHVFIDAAGVIRAISVGDLQGNSMEEFLGKIINNKGL